MTNPLALAATFAAAILAASGIGVGIHFASEPDAPDSAPEVGASHHEIAHGPAGDVMAPVMARPQFPPARGSTPTADDAADLQSISRIVIRDDEGFVPSNGVSAGNGTIENPFVITGYYVSGDLFIEDTDLCFVVRENYIAGQLTLNWNGQCAHVHHNHIADLRVNENVARTGFATGGLLESNQIEFVGQLRHYDGEFRNNVVGPRDSRSLWDPIQETAPFLWGEDPRIANIDGFNQGLIHHNTFHGSVDLDFHGHHHGTGFFAPHSHYHGGNESREMPHNHAYRWTSVAFTNNHVIDPDGYGLRYDDRQHAADDRTANSEVEETLDAPHQHFTDITIDDNRVEGAGIWVDIFNADDDYHNDVNPGTLSISGNEVHVRQKEADGPLGLPFFGSGHRHNSALRVFAAKELDATIVDNRLSFSRAANDGPLDGLPLMGAGDVTAIAIDLDNIRAGNLTVAGNVAEGFDIGVSARKMDEATAWLVTGNSFGTAKAVYYDESVANRPQE